MKLESINTGMSELLIAALKVMGITRYNINEAAPWLRKYTDNVVRSDKLLNWLKSVGVTGRVGRAMEGGVGIAYSVGDGFIVKFTTDRQEASAAAIMKGANSPNAANVYDVKRVASFDHPTDPGRQVSLYAIAVEKLNTGVGRRMRVAGGAVYSYLDNNPGFIEDPDSMIKLTINRYLPSNYRKDEETVKAVHKIVNALYNVQKHTGVLSQDTHGANLAWKGREPAFFDFGRSSIDTDNPKTAGARINGL